MRQKQTNSWPIYFTMFKHECMSVFFLKSCCKKSESVTVFIQKWGLKVKEDCKNHFKCCNLYTDWVIQERQVIWRINTTTNITEVVSAAIVSNQLSSIIWFVWLSNVSFWFILYIFIALSMLILDENCVWRVFLQHDVKKKKKKWGQEFIFK